MTACILYPEYDCAQCTGDQKRFRGCDKPAPFAYWSDIDGNPRYDCPRRPIFDSVGWYNAIIMAYNGYKNGFLPHPGGLYDQAATFLELMCLVDNATNTCQRVLDAKAARNAEGSGKSLLRG